MATFLSPQPTHPTLKPEDRFVRWSDEDQSYIGCCPDLYFGDVCHGEPEEQTDFDLCPIIRDEIAHRLAKREIVPEPSLVPA